MSSTNVNVTRDEEGNVHAHWVGHVTFDPSVYGNDAAFHSLISECIENFTTALRSEIDMNFRS